MDEAVVIGAGKCKLVKCFLPCHKFQLSINARSANMELSIFTDETGLDLVEALPVIKGWGLKNVDLRSGIYRKALESLSDDEMLTAKALIDQHGMKVACLQTSLAKVHLPGDERLTKEMAKLERIIRASEIFGCKLVRSFFFWQPPNGQEREGVGELAVRPDVLAQVMDMFLPFAEKAQAAGLVMAFENCGCTKEECYKVIDALNVPGWGLAWDPKNSWMHDKAEREKDLKGYLRKIAERTNCVHVKSTGSIWFEGGFDPIPYDAVFAALEEFGFDGPVSVETHNSNREISNVVACERVIEVVRKAWPSAAAGAQQEASCVGTDIVRDYAGNPVGFGVVGLGMGHNRAGEMTKTSGVRLVMVCDKREDRCARSSEAYGVPATREYEALLANPAVEAVMVLNETGRHGELTLQALEAGKHVLVTKPMEMSLEQCDRMIDMADEKGLVLGLDHCRRLRPSIQSLKAAHENGYFGRPLSASVTLKINRPMSYFHENGGWRGTRKLDGGVLSNQSIHHLDELLFVFGMPESVRCDVWTQTHDIEMEDLGLAVWQYADGMVVNICSTTSYPQGGWYYQMEIHGTKGAYIHREGGAEKTPVTLYYVNKAWTDQAPFPRECPWLNSMDNFASVIRLGGELLTTAQEGRNAVQIIAAMYKSAYENGGNWVSI